MERHHLEAFLVLAEELHFGRAAERLHVAQPPLSRTIKQLERELDAQLFDRTTRRVRLTSTGQALLDPARLAIESFDAIKRTVRSSGIGETGRVRLGFAGPSSHLLVGRLARLLRERHPGIELVLQSTTYAYGALRAVQEGDLDVAIARWEHAPPGIDSRVVSTEHYVIVAPCGHPLADRREVSIAELRDEAFVALPGEPGSNIRDALIRLAHEAGYSPRIVQTAPDSWTIMALVAAAVGITLSVDSALENILQEGVSVIALRENFVPTYSRLVWRRGDANPALGAVLRISEEALPTPNG